jgi:hypothetical protein
MRINETSPIPAPMLFIMSIIACTGFDPLGNFYEPLTKCFLYN